MAGSVFVRDIVDFEQLLGNTILVDFILELEIIDGCLIFTIGSGETNFRAIIRSIDTSDANE